MSEIKRLTLLSDPTDEFPNNANNSFKVRLPERLNLPGEGWHASLLSLTVPDQGQSNAIIAGDPHTKVVRYKYPQMTRKWTDTGDPATSGYLSIDVPKVTAMIELEEVMNASQIVSTGSQFWKRVMQTLHNKIMTELMRRQWEALIQDRDRKPIVFVKKHGMPQLSWDGESLVIQAISKEELMNNRQAIMVEFYINLDMAPQVWIGAQKDGQNWVQHVRFYAGSKYSIFSTNQDL